MTKGIEIIGEGKYEVAGHQQFVDRSGQLVRVVKGESAPIPIGRAYGFIECYAPKEDLQRSLTESIPSVRSLQGPKNLEFTLTEGVNPESFRAGTRLHEIASQAKDCGKHYTIESCSEMSNYKTGLELGTAIAQSARLNPGWYGKDSQTWSRIVYEQDGEYLDIE